MYVLKTNTVGQMEQGLLSMAQSQSEPVRVVKNDGVIDPQVKR